jgi:hypothetical protein
MEAGQGVNRHLTQMRNNLTCLSWDTIESNDSWMLGSRCAADLHLGIWLFFIHAGEREWHVFAKLDSVMMSMVGREPCVWCIASKLMRFSYRLTGLEIAFTLR